MEIVHLNYYFDRDLTSPEVLLRRYWRTVEWCRAVVRAGAGSVTIVQRYSRAFEEWVDGVNVKFVPDQLSARLSVWQVPREVHTVVARLQPDVVHCNGFPSPIRSLRRVLPAHSAVLWQHHGGSLPSRLHRWYYREGLQGTDGLIFTSREQAQQWVSAQIVDESLPVYEVIESSSSFRRVSTRSCRQKLRLGGQPIMLWVGRLTEKKDPLTVLRGFASIKRGAPGASLYMIYTEDPLLPRVRQLRSQLRLEDSVHLVGAVPHERLEAYYNAADYFVLGSRDEGSGFALIEAISCGSVPLVTDIPSFRQITGNGQIGGLWSCGSAGSMAACFWRTRCIQQSRKYVRAFFDRTLSFPVLGASALASYGDACSRRRAKLAGAGTTAN